jgi:hypothetical protein
VFPRAEARVKARFINFTKPNDFYICLCINFVENKFRMSLKHFRVYTRNAVLIVLSMIVLAGASGLSYTAHYCHGKLSGVAFYTGLGLQKPVSCGCKADASSCRQTESSESTDLNKISCCSNISFFNRLSVETPTNQLSSLTLVQPAFIEIGSSDSQLITAETGNLPVCNLKFRPPPIAGRKLVLFLSQQRIPFSSFNS